MKKNRIAILFTLAPFALLCACGGGTPSLGLSSNWYLNTALREVSADTFEELTYSVKLSDVPDGDYRVVYDEDGSYMTRLTGTLDPETNTAVYQLHTEFSIGGHFEYRGKESEHFVDRTSSDVFFLDVSENLRPLRSYKEIESHVPLASPDEDNLSAYYHYAYSIRYDASLEDATFAMTDLTKEGAEPVEKEIDIDDSGTYLDNEQIFFALRGLDFTSTVQFRSIDPQTQLCADVSFPSAPTASSGTFSFKVFDREGNLLEEGDRPIDTYNVNLSYRTAQPGPGREIVYAAKKNVENNVYRNVPLQITCPIMHSLGTLTYTLERAVFTTK